MVRLYTASLETAGEESAEESIHHRHDDIMRLVSTRSLDEVAEELPGTKSQNRKRLQQTLRAATPSSAKLIREGFKAPSAENLVLVQILWTSTRIAYLLTAWMFCAIQQDVLFPRCSLIWGSGTVNEKVCMATSLMFWIFPLICGILALLYFHTDLLHARLYYEMFSHRVHLDFMNIPFFQASMVRVMLSCFLLSLLMYPMTSALTVKQLVMTLPYLFPLVSFGITLWMHWDLETRLLSVAKFVEEDVERANQHMLDSYFMNDYVAEAAFHNVIKDLEHQKLARKLTMGEFIALMGVETERMYAVGEEPDEDLAFKEFNHRWTEMSMVRLVVNDHEYLDDEEAQKFRWWFFLYKTFSFTVMVCLFLLCLATVVTHLHDQGAISSSAVTEWLNLDYFTMYESQPVAGQSHAHAAAAMVSPAGCRYVMQCDLNTMVEGNLPTTLPSFDVDHTYSSASSGLTNHLMLVQHSSTQKKNSTNVLRNKFRVRDQKAL